MDKFYVKFLGKFRILKEYRLISKDDRCTLIKECFEIVRRRNDCDIDIATNSKKLFESVNSDLNGSSGHIKVERHRILFYEELGSPSDKIFHHMMQDVAAVCQIPKMNNYFGYVCRENKERFLFFYFSNTRANVIFQKITENFSKMDGTITLSNEDMHYVYLDPDDLRKPQIKTYHSEDNFRNSHEKIVKEYSLPKHRENSVRSDISDMNFYAEFKNRRISNSIRENGKWKPVDSAANNKGQDHCDHKQRTFTYGGPDWHRNGTVEQRTNYDALKYDDANDMLGLIPPPLDNSPRGSNLEISGDIPMAELVSYLRQKYNVEMEGGSICVRRL